jgi:hypothetical protein
MFPQFAAIAEPKVHPSPRIVVEPLPQFGRRSDLFDPEVERGGLLGDPARPYPIYEHSQAVRSRRRVKDALYSNDWHEFLL